MVYIIMVYLESPRNQSIQILEIFLTQRRCSRRVCRVAGTEGEGSPAEHQVPMLSVCAGGTGDAVQGLEDGAGVDGAATRGRRAKPRCDRQAAGGGGEEG
jgi:hypothetical protein